MGYVNSNRLQTGDDMTNYDSFEVRILMYGTTPDQKSQFYREMSEAWRDPKKAKRLRTWFGFIGAHHYYLGDEERGRKSSMFFWTAIPAIMALSEGDIEKRTQRVNSDLAIRIAAKIKAEVCDVGVSIRPKSFYSMVP